MRGARLWAVMVSPSKRERKREQIRLMSKKGGDCGSFSRAIGEWERKGKASASLPVQNKKICHFCERERWSNDIALSFFAFILYLTYEIINFAVTCIFLRKWFCNWEETFDSLGEFWKYGQTVACSWLCELSTVVLKLDTSFSFRQTVSKNQEQIFPGSYKKKSCSIVSATFFRNLVCQVFIVALFRMSYSFEFFADPTCVLTCIY